MHPDDAPILGNGDLTVAFAGKPEFPQFWIASNDFWEFRAPDRGGAPKALGRLIFEASAMEGASYRVEQDFLTVFCIKSLSLVAFSTPGGEKVIYRSKLNPKINRNYESFTEPDFLATITQHIPYKGAQMIRYYGWHSNKMRANCGNRAKSDFLL